jgi:hypothetical protein
MQWLLHPWVGDGTYNVGDISVAEPGQVLLHPLGRPNEAVLLAIPATKYNRAERFPPFTEGFSKGADRLVQDGRSAVGIGSSSRNPGIAMVTDNWQGLG